MEKIDDECPICLEVMLVHTKENKRIRLPCRHWFHTTCISEFFKTKGIPICPYCRYELSPCNSLEQINIEYSLCKFGSNNLRSWFTKEELFKNLRTFIIERNVFNAGVYSSLTENQFYKFYSLRLENLVDRCYFEKKDKKYKYIP